MPVQRWSTVIRTGLMLALFAAITACASRGEAQLGGGGGIGTGGNNFFGVIGGIVIDAEGAVTGNFGRLSEKDRQALMEVVRGSKELTSAPTGVRAISLRQLEIALRDSLANRKPVDLDAACLGGLQKIENLVLLPESGDILIVGQGDAWTVNEAGAIVGANNGQPMIHLQDLVVALRAVDAANDGPGVSVSIDPTEAGVRNYQEKVQQISAFDPSFAPALEAAMGQQNITLTGVPATSRFAQVMVNADYRMKRLSMGFEKAPIDNFPSLLEMLQKKNGTFGQMSPRFWMECNYEPVARSEDGLIWKLRGQGVKTLTQEHFFDKDGKRQADGRGNGLAEKWATNMTERFQELAAADPVFAELRNIMDLSVIAAIIRKHDLLTVANADLPNLFGTVTSVSLPEFHAPRTIPTQCSFVRTDRGWTVTASGGLLIDSWSIASNVEVDPTLSSKALALPASAGQRIWAAANN